MKKILVLVMVLCGVCFGSMTRDQVCIEQSGFNQAAGNIDYGGRRGFNVWSAYGKNSDEWICWQNVMIPAQKAYRFILSNASEGDTYTLTIGAVDITYTCLAGTSDVIAAAGLVAAWNASEEALCTPIEAIHTAGTGYTYFVGVPAVEFAISGTSVGGTITRALQQDEGATPNTLSCFGAFKCNVKAGYYMALNKSITNTSAGPIWYPTPSAGGPWGAGKDVTNSAAWSVSTLANTSNTNGFSYMYSATATRTLSLLVPSGVTRLYMLGVAQPSTGARTVALAAKTGDEAKFTLDKATVNFSETGDFTNYGEDVYTPFYETTNYDGYPNYKSVCLIAQDFTSDATIVITPTTAATNQCNIVGFIAINDNSTAQPDTGVFDPTTIEYLMPSSYNSTGTQTAYQQYAEGPLYLNINGGTPTFWGNGHWGGASSSDVLNLLQSSTSIVSYDKTAFFTVTQTSYSPPTDLVWIRYTADSVTSSTTGIIDVDDGTTNAAGLGTYNIMRQWTSSGMAITQKWAFDSDAETAVLKLDIENDLDGGYISQWSLDKDFTKYMFLPYNTVKQSVGAYDDSYGAEYNATSIILFDETHSVEALFSSGFYYYDASASSCFSKPTFKLYKRNIGDGYAKVYLSPIQNTATANEDIPIQTGDEIYSFQFRSFTNTNGLEADYTRGWLNR